MEITRVEYLVMIFYEKVLVYRGVSKNNHKARENKKKKKREIKFRNICGFVA